MVRDYIVKAASMLMLIGFAAGIAAQLELLKPGISFMNFSLWYKILTLHIWATPVSLAIICLSTISLIRDRRATEQWAVWLGFCALPLLFGVLLNVMLANVQPPESILLDTVYLTANRHAYGTVALLITLGGLSALQTVKFKKLSLKVSFGFAFLINCSGVALAFLQFKLGIQGMPRRYSDYPPAFAQSQFYASIAAMTCFTLAAIYVILLWRQSDKKAGIIKEVF